MRLDTELGRRTVRCRPATGAPLRFATSLWCLILLATATGIVCRSRWMLSSASWLHLRPALCEVPPVPAGTRWGQCQSNGILHRVLSAHKFDILASGYCAGIFLCKGVTWSSDFQFSIGAQCVHSLGTSGNCGRDGGGSCNRWIFWATEDCPEVTSGRDQCPHVIWPCPGAMPRGEGL